MTGIIKVDDLRDAGNNSIISIPKEFAELDSNNIFTLDFTNNPLDEESIELLKSMKNVKNLIL